MNQLNLFIELTRLKRPIGYMLLFWPCAWGLTIAFDFSKNIEDYIFYLILIIYKMSNRIKDTLTSKTGKTLTPGVNRVDLKNG